MLLSLESGRLGGTSPAVCEVWIMRLEEEEAVAVEMTLDLTGSSRVEVRMEESVGRRGGVAGRIPVDSDFLDFFSRFWKCEYLEERRERIIT